MEKVHVDLRERSYDIHIGTDLFTSPDTSAPLLSPFVKNRKVLIAADSNTEKLFSAILLKSLQQAGAETSVFSFPAGEESKKFSTVEKICRSAAQNGLDRSSLMLALGGGVTGDMTGFAASIYMRGIDYIQVPTTLLAMVDSSVGGKTGVDLPEGKNLTGTFHQPKTVLMDIAFLRSLPVSELRCGYAELIKHAVLFDPDLFQKLESNSRQLLALGDLDLLSKLLARSCALKAAVVAEDERESSKRALLNYGHSFGHAIEKLMNYSGITHGDAVSVGMCMAADLSVLLGKMKHDDAERQNALLRMYNLPVSVNGFTPEAVLQAMSGDKKNIGGKMRLVIPSGIGKAKIVSGIEEKFILNAIGKHCD